MPLPPVWTRPIGYKAQCWIAWVGLTGFGLSGWIDWRADEGFPPVKLVALVLSLAWGIDLLRGRRVTPD